MTHRHSLIPKPIPGIKQHVTGFHTTEVIAHKASYSKLYHKIGRHGNVPQHRWIPSNTIPMAHSSPQPEWYLDRFICFCTDDCRVPLYFTMERPFPPQYCCFPWGIWTPSNTWFFRPIRVLNPNVISIGPSISAGLTIVTDRQTDKQTTLLGQ